jgi:hypothetical protein
MGKSKSLKKIANDAKARHNDISALIDGLDVGRKCPSRSQGGKGAGNYSDFHHPDVQQTCFFWYHGNCRWGPGCFLKHELPQGPGMLEAAPSGFKHPGACDLEWCPAPGKKQKDSERKAAVDSNLEGADTEMDDETCFFWYHGMCAQGKRCKRMHSLPEKPKMIEPPASFVHSGPCELEWCPGEGEQREESREWIMMLAETEASEAEKQEAATTCFFWYHGNCAKKRCNRMHSLPEKPETIEPPPRFVHPAPCGSEWCGGDGKEVRMKRHGFARREEGLKGLGDGWVEKMNRGEGQEMKDDVSEAPSCGQEEKKPEWFLSGFD